MPTTNDRLLLIKNGRVIDPATKTDATNDVLLDGVRTAKIGTGLSAPDAEIFDASGMIVAPGFIDLHCHLREPGQEMSETIETGARSAARSGFTAVCCMPNTQPVNDNASVTRSIVERAAAADGVEALSGVPVDLPVVRYLKQVGSPLRVPRNEEVGYERVIAVDLLARPKRQCRSIALRHRLL